MIEINFKNKTVLITGGTRGLGASMVKLFSDCGAKIIATTTNEQNLDSLNSKYKNVEYAYLDLSSENSIDNFFNFLKSKKQIDVLINNAGINKIDKITNINSDDWSKILNVNLSGPFKLIKKISQLMKQNNYGRIVNISSIFGVVSKEKRSSYSSSKWGLIGLTKAVALDLSRYNILVNSVSPGFVYTELTKKILGDNGIEDICKEIPLMRLASPEEIAKTVIFISSHLNTYITGQNIIIDGGFTSA
tara:strand:- start:3486 stop:4226 length:741 start_codon:yes stop_codon:yes gene_type:complete